MIRLLQPERREIPALYRENYFRGLSLEADAIPPKVIMDQGLNGTELSTTGLRWSVPFLIVWEPESRVVGTIGGKGLLAGETEVEIGYNVALAYRGRGIVSRAIAGVRELAAQDGLDLVAHVEPDNEASRRALLRNNFRLEGIVRLPAGLKLECWYWSAD